ncbi:MAG: hypothetical protein ACLR70_06650 [Streptococcus thermophilus]
MGDINLMWILSLRPRPMRKMGQLMISVLTDEVFFKGDISTTLMRFRPQVAIPTLAKDFIIDEKQIVRRRNAWSDGHSLDCRGPCRSSGSRSSMILRRGLA